jgi:hypothetical protein
MFGQDISASLSNDPHIPIELGNKFLTIDNKEYEDSSLLDSNSLGMGISSSLSAIRIYQPGRKESPLDEKKMDIFYEDIR